MTPEQQTLAYAEEKYPTLVWLSKTGTGPLSDGYIIMKTDLVNSESDAFIFGNWVSQPDVEKQIDNLAKLKKDRNI